MMRNGTRLFQAVQCGVRCLLLVAVFPTDRVKNVVDDLKRQADSITKTGYPREIGVRRPAKIRASPHGSADQGARF